MKYKWIDCRFRNNTKSSAKFQFFQLVASHSMLSPNVLRICQLWGKPIYERRATSFLVIQVKALCFCHHSIFQDILFTRFSMVLFELLVHYWKGWNFWWACGWWTGSFCSKQDLQSYTYIKLLSKSFKSLSIGHNLEAFYCVFHI